MNKETSAEENLKEWNEHVKRETVKWWADKEAREADLENDVISIIDPNKDKENCNVIIEALAEQLVKIGDSNNWKEDQYDMEKDVAVLLRWLIRKIAPTIGIDGNIGEK